MEQLIGTPFESLNLPEDAKISLSDKVLYVKKWHWEYEDCLSFQKSAQLIISKNRTYKVYIFCNHPHCFTLGRGNERAQENLVEFDTSITRNLSYPVHQIHRGGGITFHYPGQWIFYPIVSINEKYPLEEHMCWLLKTVKDVLKESYGLNDVMAAKKLMGVWLERRKLASIGVGLNRFVSEHGIALNLVYDEEMFKELKKINPCGMNPTTYTALSLVSTKLSSNIIEEFHSNYIKSIAEK